MSEPMTNIEIEDVLSSIRRLVSEDVAKAKPRPSLLLLTPALRVAPAEGAEPAVASPEATPDAPEAEAAEALKPPVEASAEAAPGAEAGLAPESPAHVGPPPPAMSLEERIADLEAAIGQSEEEFEPDGSEDLSVHIPDDVLRPVFGAATTSTRAAAWEVQPEPPVTNLPETSATDPVPPEESPAAATAGAVDQDDLVEEALIDEDSLREIVAELVRQELRGELGERITRNVRRLVRREINRALALQELEDDEA